MKLNTQSTFALLRFCVVVVSWTAISQLTVAQTQDKTAAQESAAPTSALTFSEPIESTWEFGLKINCAGNAKGVNAVVPIPMDWPEQEIELLSEEKTKGVGRFKQSNPTQYTRQFSFKVNRMSNSESTGYIRFKIKKRLIIAPQDTSQFAVPKRVPKKLRTFLQPSPYIESDHKKIREIAASLKDETLSSWEQVEKVYKWVRENVEYKFDVNIHSCLDALESGKGDCEELSSMFIAICRALKIPARAVWVPDHTYPEFYLEDKKGKGHWFPCQAAGDYEFGAMSDDRPILQKGDRFRRANQTGFVRYLQPTLTAKDLKGGISIDWISRKIEDEANNSDQKR